MLFGLRVEVSEVLCLIKGSADKHEGSITASQTNFIKTWRQVHFILKDYLTCRVFSSGDDAKMGAGATPMTESEDDPKMLKTKGDTVSLPKHSYWFDFWAFVVFDIAFFLFMYYIVP